MHQAKEKKRVKGSNAPAPLPHHKYNAGNPWTKN